MRPKRRLAPRPTDDVLWHDVRALLGADSALSPDADAPFHFREELDVVVDRLSSAGDALALSPPDRPRWVIVTPFALPGEHIRVRVYRSAQLHSFADLVAVLKPNPDWRDDTRVQCKYFGKCSGCQYQMLAYEKQLELKRDVVVKAYRNFAGKASLPPSSRCSRATRLGPVTRTDRPAHDRLAKAIPLPHQNHAPL